MGAGEGKGYAEVVCPVLCLGLEEFPDVQHGLLIWFSSGEKFLRTGVGNGFDFVCGKWIYKCATGPSTSAARSAGDKSWDNTAVFGDIPELYLVTSQNFVSGRTGKGTSPVTRE